MSRQCLERGSVSGIKTTPDTSSSDAAVFPLKKVCFHSNSRVGNGVGIKPFSLSSQIKRKFKVFPCEMGGCSVVRMTEPEKASKKYSNKNSGLEPHPDCNSVVVFALKSRNYLCSRSAMSRFQVLRDHFLSNSIGEHSNNDSKADCDG